MSDFIKLTCPSCGGKLEITRDITHFSCGSCGNELIVRQSGGAFSISPIVEGMKEIQTGVDKTASELAIIRLKEEISSLVLARENNITELSGLINSCNSKLWQTKPISLSLWSILFGLATIMSLGVFFLLLIKNDYANDTLITVFIFSLLFGIAWFLSYKKDHKKENLLIVETKFKEINQEITKEKEELENKLSNITLKFDTEITRKEVELKMHQEIVDKR